MDNNESHDENIRRNQTMEGEPPETSGGVCNHPAIRDTTLQTLLEALLPGPPKRVCVADGAARNNSLFIV